MSLPVCDSYSIVLHLLSDVFLTGSRTMMPWGDIAHASLETLDDDSMRCAVFAT